MLAAVVFFMIPMFELEHPKMGKVLSSPLQVAASFASGAFDPRDAPAPTGFGETFAKSLLMPGALWKNGWRVLECKVMRKEYVCGLPLLGWGSVLESLDPLLKPSEVRAALAHTFPDTLGHQLITTGSVFMCVAAVITLVHSSAILSVIGCACTVYAVYKYKVPFKSGIFVSIYLTVMSTRMPGSRRTAAISEQLEMIAKFESIVRSATQGKDAGEVREALGIRDEGRPGGAAKKAA